MNATSSVSPASSPSRSSSRLWLRRAAIARFGAGPLVLVGFFLPWATGPGPFAATDFTGFTLVGFAGRLQALDLSIAADGTLWGVRLAILGVAVAATWQTLLAPAHRWHFAYGVSGWYIVASAAVMVALGLLRTGFAVPPAGFALTVAGGLLFLTSRMAADDAALATADA